jgi:hypothetical protein
MRRKPSKRGSGTGSSTMLRSGLMSQLSPRAGLRAMLTQLSRDSRASRSRSLGSELVRATSVISSQMLSGPLLTLDASSSGWKTCQVCLFPIQTGRKSLHQLQTFLDSWPKAALMLHGYLYPQKTWELLTGEIDGGALHGKEPWSSPTANDAITTDGSFRPSREATGRNTDYLARQVKKPWATPADDDANNASRATGSFWSLTRDVQNWASPRAEDAEYAGERRSRGIVDTLHAQTKMWATPSARDKKGANMQSAIDRGRRREDQLANQVSFAGEERADGLLNPEWSEILMGWPRGWTDVSKPCDGIWYGFPMGQGLEQFDYEPARLVPKESVPMRTRRIRMIGNGVVPMCGSAAYLTLLDLLGVLPRKL